MQLKFSGKIDSIGVNPYVFLPPHILKQLFLEAKKEKGAIQVKGRINHKEFIQTLVKYRGKWRLYINGIMRKEAQVSVGDQITIVIEFDPAIREVPMHELLKQALEKDKKAKQAFDAYPPSRKKEINRYLHNIKTEAIVKKHINRIVHHLHGEEVPYFVLLRNRK